MREIFFAPNAKITQIRLASVRSPRSVSALTGQWPALGGKSAKKGNRHLRPHESRLELGMSNQRELAGEVYAR